jgi:hypothetical protein
VLHPIQRAAEVLAYGLTGPSGDMDRFTRCGQLVGLLVEDVCFGGPSRQPVALIDSCLEPLNEGLKGWPEMRLQG